MGFSASKMRDTDLNAHKSYPDPKPHRDFPDDSIAKYDSVMNCTKDFWLIMPTPAGKI